MSKQVLGALLGAAALLATATTPARADAMRQAGELSPPSGVRGALDTGAGAMVK